jgi:hypothetical protein
MILVEASLGLNASGVNKKKRKESKARDQPLVPGKLEGTGVLVS